MDIDNKGNRKNLSPEKQANNNDVNINELVTKYQLLFENVPIPYQSLNDDGTLKNVNPAWLQKLGYTKEEVIGDDFRDFLHPDSRSHFVENFPKFKIRGYVHDVMFKIKHKSGHYIDISYEGRIGYNSDGSFKQTFCVFKDISEQKKTELELINAKEKAENAELRIRRLINNLESGVVVHASDTSIIFNNERASELLGLSAEQMKGKQALDSNWKFVYENDKQIPPEEFPVNQIVASKKSLRNMLLGVVRPKTEDKVWLLVNGIPFFDKNNNLTEVIINFNDISERKEAENELNKHREQLEELVKERTIDLESKNKELDNAMKVFVGREIQIKELQNQIKELKGQ